MGESAELRDWWRRIFRTIEGLDWYMLGNDDGEARGDVQQKLDFNFTFEFRK